MPSFMPIQPHHAHSSHQAYATASAFRTISHHAARAARTIAAGLAIAALALTSGCSGAGSTDAGSGSSGLRKVTFMLSWAPDTNHIGVYVAKDRGYFAQAGLDVDIIAVSQAGAEQAVQNGQADFALSNLTNVADYSVKGAQLTEVLQVQQKPSAIWCALASNTAITRPKDLDGKTFATFGSNEDDAVIKAMIRNDGGQGTFDKVTVGTSTFQTLSSGQADFGGFYATWEGVQAKLNGPQLNCFTEPDYGIPGNADSIGVITSNATISSDPDLVKAFVQATQRGYEYAYANPDDAAGILVKGAADANLDETFVKESMKTIVDGQYWGDRDAIVNGTARIGDIDFDGVQKYLDFLSQAGTYTDENGDPVAADPQATGLATDDYLAQAQKASEL
ncbi:MAG: ABC transporter substrate-binding protein [Bifidobacteriaceae bacterium]|nr:ABC transporter substrate-binding protein [Bifidobacteriaceae bacterium]